MLLIWVRPHIGASHLLGGGECPQGRMKERSVPGTSPSTQSMCRTFPGTPLSNLCTTHRISCVPRTPCRHAPQSIPPTPTHRPHYPQVKSDPSTKIILEGSQSTLAFYLSSGAKVRGGQEG